MNVTKTYPVAVTGLGVVGPPGNTINEWDTMLRAGTSCIVEMPDEYSTAGVLSKAFAPISFDLRQAMGRDWKNAGILSALSYYAATQAIEMARLPDELVRSEDTAMLIGSGGPAVTEVVQTTQLNKTAPQLVRAVQRTMLSTPVAHPSTLLKIYGGAVSLSSACATGLHNIMYLAEKIWFGRRKRGIAGGVEYICPQIARFFDTPKALARELRDTPAQSSRPFDKDRDGFVIDQGGAGVVTLERLEDAIARGAHIYALLTGWGESSDGFNITQPSGDGAYRAMKEALEMAFGSLENAEEQLDLIGAHGTSTPLGDLKEADAIGRLSKNSLINVNALKSFIGHGLGPAGAWALIAAILQIAGQYMHKTLNVDEVDPAIVGKINVIRKFCETNIEHVCVNAFGFGGTNGSLVVSRYHP